MMIVNITTMHSLYNVKINNLLLLSRTHFCLAYLLLTLWFQHHQHYRTFHLQALVVLSQPVLHQQTLSSFQLPILQLHPLLPHLPDQLAGEGEAAEGAVLPAEGPVELQQNAAAAHQTQFSRSLNSSTSHS